MRFLLPLLLLATPAGAECPTASDLARGIRMTWTDGKVTTVRATNDPVIQEVRTDWPDGNYEISTSAWGLFDLGGNEISTGEPMVARIYEVEPSRMPRPAASTVVTFPRVVSGGGFQPDYLRETYRMGPLGTATLGGCSFRAFEVTLAQAVSVVDEGRSAARRFTDPNRAWAYLVDLGLAVDIWLTGEDEVRYPVAAVVSIEPVP